MASEISTLRFIRCTVGSETYGLDMSWVRGIQRTDLLQRNSETEGGDLATDSGRRPMGWLPRREGDIPVFGLARLLGRASGDALRAASRIVVLNSPTAEDQPWALLVDRVSQVIQAPMERVAPVPPAVVNPAKAHFEGVIRLGGALTLLLSPARLHPDAVPRVIPPAAARAPAFQGREQAPATHRDRGQGQIVVFRTTPPRPGERAIAYGLSITQVPEILRPLSLIPVPGAPGFVLGLANWRDRPVPIVDLDARLGLASEAGVSANGRTRLVIARDRGAGDREMLAGFLIRPAIRTLRLPLAHQASDRVLSLERALTRGVVELEDETLVIPDVGKVVSNQ